MNKKLHILLIGINHYPNCRPLSGCINDAMAVGAYFEAFCTQNQITPVFRYLLSPSGPTEASLLETRGIAYERPERARVVRAIRELFQQADPERGDGCLLYYSGHGSTLPAPEVFSDYESTNGKLQTIVCVDSRDAGNRDLLDKELGYLIAEGLQGKAYDPDNKTRPGVHFLSIMDCCFAGNNLRGDEEKVNERMVSGKNLAIQAEDLEGFAAAGNVFYAPLANGKVDRYSGLRHARYVSLSASRDHQPALEKAFDTTAAIEGQPPAKTQHGVFTWSLLRTLQRSGALLSYSELLRRVEMEVRGHNSTQVPLLWARDGSGDEQRAFFGDDTLQLPSAAFELAWRETSAGLEWVVNAGALHGVVPSTPEQATTFLLQDGSQRVVRVRAVHAHESILENDLFTEADRTVALKAVLHQWSFTRPRVAFDKALPPDMRSQIAARLAKNSGIATKMSYIEWAATEDPAVDYLVRSVEDAQKSLCFVLTPKGSNLPLFPGNPSAAGFLSDLECVGKWAFTLRIANPTVEKMLRSSIAVEVQLLEGVPIDRYNTREYASAQWETVLQNPPEIAVRIIDGIKSAVKIKIANHSFEKYWVGVLYLDALYGISSKFAPVSQIGAGAEADFLELGRLRPDGTFNPIILLSFDPFYHTHGISEVTDYLMIVVSREKFDLSAFDQGCPPLDVTRTLGFPDEVEIPDTDAWFTITIPVHIHSPIGPVGRE